MRERAEPHPPSSAGFLGNQVIDALVFARLRVAFLYMGMEPLNEVRGDGKFIPGCAVEKIKRLAIIAHFCFVPGLGGCILFQHGSLPVRRNDNVLDRAEAMLEVTMDCRLSVLRSAGSAVPSAISSPPWLRSTSLKRAAKPSVS